MVRGEREVLSLSCVLDNIQGVSKKRGIWVTVLF